MNISIWIFVCGSLEISKFIFLAIGGNDISVIFKPEDIFADICNLVKAFKEAGVQEVLISEIPLRADFSKTNPPGLTKARFDRQRKKINGLQQEKYVDRFHQVPRYQMSTRKRPGAPLRDRQLLVAKTIFSHTSVVLQCVITHAIAKKVLFRTNKCHDRNQ